MNARIEWCTHIQLSEVAQCKSHTCMSSFKASSLFLSLPNESVIKPVSGRWEGECVLGTHRHTQCCSRAGLQMGVK